MKAYDKVIDLMIRYIPQGATPRYAAAHVCTVIIIATEAFLSKYVLLLYMISI